MERIKSHEDAMKGVARYRLDDGRMVCLDADMVRQIGLTAAMRYAGVELAPPTRRLPVFQNGREIGTMSPDFDPDFIRSRSWLYEPRPGDFRRDGDKWVANRMLGPGDFEAIPGFQRSEPRP